MSYEYEVTQHDDHKNPALSLKRGGMWTNCFFFSLYYQVVKRKFCVLYIFPIRSTNSFAEPNTIELKRPVTSPPVLRVTSHLDHASSSKKEIKSWKQSSTSHVFKLCGLWGSCVYLSRLPISVAHIHAVVLINNLSMYLCVIVNTKRSKRFSPLTSVISVW